MTNDMTIHNGSDGFDDAAADYSEALNRGSFMKLVGGQYFVGREQTPMPLGSRLVAIGTAAAWMKWRDNRPVETLIRKPGEKLPERDALGDLDESEWQAGPDGKPRDPWQHTRALYLTDPRDAAIYTFSTSSWSGRGAVIGLADQITRMRVARPGVSPVIELGSAPHKHKHGTTMKPIFKVVGWVGGSGEGADLRQIGKPARVEVLDDMANDEVPW